MSQLYRGLIIDVDLEPTEGSETGKTRPCIILQIIFITIECL